ncbi:hypothetical protein COT97_01765 [Candidatus Falkowbacteria bacterium CG10_big_fil_rev_8_21_14_0_10_39_11]|uniref:Peptidase S54 rhomboid domain-containing protein n=1 Tax=Candidatus Falkowbacteria bacterium CG10_big_fil_rev_8_21_14_0_10_39_11 TaxID=1974565 RepID=A0A2H0V5F1_9BACT|nr:MAG: hypothetical protein COT97_01765 [Candidatus Falkowbacteria bacterium CG10_big_fil_rev_8_21_14_0_10_39_11]
MKPDVIKILIQDRSRPIKVLPWIIFINFAIYLTLLIFGQWLDYLPVEFIKQHFLVSWNAVAEGRIWVLLTAMFAHVYFYHILLNMFVLFSFGFLLERLMGPKKFLIFYLAAGIISNIIYILTNKYMLGITDQLALGASGAIFGALIFYCLIFPKSTLLLFFIIPFPALLGAIVFIGIEIIGFIGQIYGFYVIADNVAHNTHLGGVIVGIVYYLIFSQYYKSSLKRITRPYRQIKQTS